jgi:hypothetical protein
LSCFDCAYYQALVEAEKYDGYEVHGYCHKKAVSAYPVYIPEGTCKEKYIKGMISAEWINVVLDGVIGCTFEVQGHSGGKICSYVRAYSSEKGLYDVNYIRKDGEKLWLRNVLVIYGSLSYEGKTVIIHYPKHHMKKKEHNRNDLLESVLGCRIQTHYGTGGIVESYSGPYENGYYSIIYREQREGQRPGICGINTIKTDNGVITCEGVPLKIKGCEKEIQLTFF